MDVDRAAAIVVAELITVDAPADVVWALLTDVDAWTHWQPEITAAHAGRALEVGVTFEWCTAGLELASTVGAIVPDRFVGWSGTAHGIHGVHIWTVTPGPDGTTVETVESWDGEPVPQDVDNLERLLRASLQTWLRRLAFGWIKTIAGGRKLRYIGRDRNRAWFKITTAVYNLLRITALDAATT